MGGAVSLSSVQFMYLADLSASVQLQLNNLRDGSATANNAINARFANSASVANNALSLGGFAAAAYPRLSTSNTFSAVQIVAVSGDCYRLAGTNPYLTFYNAAQTARAGYFQAIQGSSSILIVNEMSGPLDLHCTQIRHNGSGIVWHSDNDGPGSGLNADVVDGYEVAEAATPNTLAARNVSGHIFAAYLNQSSSESENPNINSVFVSNGDGYLRKATPAYFGSQIQTRNITGKSGTAKTISSSAPSGGVDGDIWYQIVS